MRQPEKGCEYLRKISEPSPHFVKKNLAEAVLIHVNIVNVRLEKRKTLFLLGAGCSAHCKVPLMTDFLDEAYRIRRYTNIDISRSEFDKVFSALVLLNGVHAKAQLNLENLESVFSAFDMANLFARLGPMTPDEIAGLVPALKTVILETIEVTQEFRQVDGQVKASSEYESFAKLVKELQNEEHDVSVLTFNYDVGLDVAFTSDGIPFSYNLNNTEHEHLPLLKLHGSLNWGLCPKCKEINEKPVKSEMFSPVDLGASYAQLRHSKRLAWVHECGAREEPFIVPPTWNKAQHYSAIGPVWKIAASKLAEAENIFVIGYSLPDSDQFFRFLFGLGTLGEARLERFWVFNPDLTLGPKFSMLLGPVAKNRYRYNHPIHENSADVSGYFDSAIACISRHLVTTPPRRQRINVRPSHWMA